MLQRSRSLNQRAGGEGGDPLLGGAASPASPAGGGSIMSWAPNSPAPVQRAGISVVQQDQYNNLHHPSTVYGSGAHGAGAAGINHHSVNDLEGKDHHEQYEYTGSRKAIISGSKARLKAEQAVHLIPLVLLLCGLVLWLATPSEYFNPISGVNNESGDNTRYEDDLTDTQGSIEKTVSNHVLKLGNNNSINRVESNI